ncbi:MAG: hypothetical protein EBR94_08895 [Bacteroidetes bacterium]|jgi:hypothetical protein|nr:hypothetical protein [Bacteroidota bacterium]
MSDECKFVQFKRREHLKFSSVLKCAMNIQFRRFDSLQLIGLKEGIRVFTIEIVTSQSKNIKNKR